MLQVAVLLYLGLLFELSLYIKGSTSKPRLGEHAICMFAQRFITCTCMIFFVCKWGIPIKIVKINLVWNMATPLSLVFGTSIFKICELGLFYRRLLGNQAIVLPHTKYTIFVLLKRARWNVARQCLKNCNTDGHFEKRDGFGCRYGCP